MRKIAVETPRQVIGVSDNAGLPTDAPGRLLILMNPGRMSRPWLLGIGVAAERMGIPTDTFELQRVWEERLRGCVPDPISFRETLRRKNFRVVLSYTSNGSWE